MHKLILAAGLVASLALAGCEGQVSQAEATPPPEKKSLARPAQMYAGQDQIMAVQNATVEVGEGGVLKLKATGATETAGWTDAAFLPRIYAAQPPDGIYEVDVIATKPTGAAAQAVTPIELSGEWGRYTDGRVKGVKFIAKTNEVVAMVPQAEASSAAQ